MPLIFYYLGASSAVRSVDLIIHALDLKAEYKNISLFDKEHLTPEYLKINPLHTVPAIDDNGFCLWESRAIMTYLVSKYGKDDSLYPKDLQKRAIVDQRLHYSNDYFAIAKQAAGPVLFTQTMPSQELLAKAREAQENLEKLLEGNKFIAGDSITVADYSFITLVEVLEVFSPMDDKFPLTRAWVKRCKTAIKDYNEISQKHADKLIADIKRLMA